MQSLDLRVVEQAIDWLTGGRTLWLCTVISTFGSSPREPGSMMVARSDGNHLGSLSGGCVEEDFLNCLSAGQYDSPAVIIRYGDSSADRDNPHVRLPCGGLLEVLVERMEPGANNLTHLRQMQSALRGEQEGVRLVSLVDGHCSFEPAEVTGPRVTCHKNSESVQFRIGPVARLILAGYSTVSEACAEFALRLGYQVILCDPREEVTRTMALPEGVEFIPMLPSVYIASETVCTSSTAVVAATHDPRIDDLAVMAAVRTTAGYIGVMGSVRTSAARAERLRRSGGLSDAEIERIQMPIGLNLGSKTPSEIALAIMADIVRVRRGILSSGIHCRYQNFQTGG